MNQIVLNSPLVSVVIVNYKGENVINRCVSSVQAQTYKHIEIIIIDNASADASVEYLKSLSDPNISVNFLEKNTGFCGGNNRGIEMARGELIVLLNNDAEAEPTWVEELVVASQKYPEAGMFASKIMISFERHRFDSTGLLLYPDGICRSRGWLEFNVGQFEEEVEVLGPNGAAACYRRSMLQETGLFDERYFAYLEDMDIAMRGWLKGYSCVYIPSAVVYHIKSASSGHHSKVKAFYVERNRLWNLFKLFPAWIILLSPLFTFYRYLLQTFAAITHHGASGKFVRNYSRWELFWTLLKAIVSGVCGLPTTLKQRSAIHRGRRISRKDFHRRVISRFKLPAIELAFKD